MKIRTLQSRTPHSSFGHHINFKKFVEPYCCRRVRSIYRTARRAGLSPTHARYLLTDLLVLGSFVDSTDFVKDTRHG
jgi:hypothetical protein